MRKTLKCKRKNTTFSLWSLLFKDTPLITDSFCSQAGKKDTFAEIKEMFKEIKDAVEVNKEKKRVKEIIKCVICQSTCTSSLFFCVAGCGQLIGCFYCASRLQDCPLCRVSLPDTEIRKPLKVSGLADYLGDCWCHGILWNREARVNANNVEDGDDEIL